MKDQKYQLTNETIDFLSEKISEMYKEAGCTTKETLRAQLMLETALMKYQAKFGEEVSVTYRIYKIVGQRRCSIKVEAPSYDPFTTEDNPMAFMVKSIMSSFETGVPTWKYKNLNNEILFALKKKATISPVAKIGIGLALALILGIIARLCFSAQALTTFVNDYVNPLTDAYAGIFCVMAVLLTFFALALSIIHLGDMASVGAVGGKIMARFLIICSVVAVVFMLPILPFFDLSGSNATAVSAKSLYDILVGFIPTNLVSPFLNFNSVHIMIIGAMFGFALLTMGQKGSALSEIFEECNLVAILTNNFLNKFIFIYAAVKLFSLVTTSEFALFASAGKMVIAILIAEAILLLAYTIYACKKSGRTLKEFLHVVTPSFVVGLSSANFGAAFSTIFDSILGAGVDTDTTSLSVNLGSVFFQPACTMVFVFSALFMAAEYNVEISIVWVIIAVVLSIILVGTMPNVPGASIAVMTLLFSQLGIPGEGLAIVIAINAILQFITVGVDIWCLQSEILVIDANNKAKAQ